MNQCATSPPSTTSEYIADASIVPATSPTTANTPALRAGSRIDRRSATPSAARTAPSIRSYARLYGAYRKAVGKTNDSTVGTKNSTAQTMATARAPRRVAVLTWGVRSTGAGVSYAYRFMSNLPRGGVPVRQPSARLLPSEVGSPGFAAVLSGLLPGLGQFYEGRWVKGLLMLILPVFAVTLGLAFVAYADPLTAFVLQHAPLVTFVLIGAALMFHLYVVGDAFAGRLGRLRGRMAFDYAVLALVTLALIAGYGTIYRQSAPWASL